MANLTGSERGIYVQTMFARIARRYDLMNRLMTVGQDVRWRKDVILLTDLQAGQRLLDLGSGTGDLVFEAARQIPGVRTFPTDFTIEMLRVGQGRPGGDRLPWLGADALQLPFQEGIFDAVVSGFLMRNVSDIMQTLREQYRVLKPDGRIVILDTTRPSHNLLTPLINIHLRYIIPALGRLIANQPEAYRYLPETTASFLTAEQLAARLQSAGFRAIHFQRRMFGTVAIHWAKK